MNRKIISMALLALMLASTLATHAVLTARAGETLPERGWVQLKEVLGGGVGKVVIATDARRTLYCAAGGIWKSTDGGLNWVSAHGNLSTRMVSEIAVDPFRPNTLFLATNQGLFKTTDGGLTWILSRVDAPPVYPVNVIVIDPMVPDTVYVGTGNGIYKSTNGGATWVVKNSGLAITGWAGGLLTIVGLAIDPVDTSRLYASTYRSYFHVSTNAGESWTAVQSLWGGPIVVSKSDPSVVYTTNDAYWGPTFKGHPIIKSTDKGASWFGVTPPIGPYDGVSHAAINPANVNVVYAGTGYGVYKSTDGAASWVPVLLLAGVSHINSITIDSTNPSNLYVATFAQGVYKSTDAGASWVQASTGVANMNLPDIDVNNADPSQIYAVVHQEGVLRSADSGRTWDTTGFSRIGISTVATHPTNPNIIFVDGWDPTTRTGIWKSTDGGITWRAVYGEGAHHVAFHPLDPSKMFASIGDTPGGILMSTNGGESWFNPQWHYIYPSEYAFHPTDPDKIWVGYSQYWGPSVNRMGVAYSTNGGWTWSEAKFGYGLVSSLVLDPNNPSTLYVACPYGIYGGIDYTGVWKSTDSGFTWTKKNTGLVNSYVMKLVIDKMTGSLYAATALGVFLSKDGAESWTSISPVSELPHQLVHSMALTPDGTRLYIGTSGGIYVYAEVKRLVNALVEISNLRAFVGTLYEAGKISQYKYERIINDLRTTEHDIVDAMYYLDTIRNGFDDKIEGLEILKIAVGRLESLINAIESAIRQGTIQDDVANEIIQRLEAINLAMSNKARFEAESERMLAVAGLEDAEARGKDVRWLWNKLPCIDQNLAYGDYWLTRGRLSKAIYYCKLAFYQSQYITVNAYDSSWGIALQDWIDQLEQDQ